MHSNKYYCELINPVNVFIDETLWITIPILFSSRLCYSASDPTKEKVKPQPQPHPASQHNTSASASASLSPQPPRQQLDNKIYYPPGYNKPIVLKWIDGQISNFEYLLAVIYTHLYFNSVTLNFTRNI